MFEPPRVVPLWAHFSSVFFLLFFCCLSLPNESQAMTGGYAQGSSNGMSPRWGRTFQQDMVCGESEKFRIQSQFVNGTVSDRNSVDVWPTQWESGAPFSLSSRASGMTARDVGRHDDAWLHALENDLGSFRQRGRARQRDPFRSSSAPVGCLLHPAEFPFVSCWLHRVPVTQVRPADSTTHPKCEGDRRAIVQQTATEFLQSLASRVGAIRVFDGNSREIRQQQWSISNVPLVCLELQETLNAVCSSGSRTGRNNVPASTFAAKRCAAVKLFEWDGEPSTTHSKIWAFVFARIWLSGSIPKVSEFKRAL